LIFLGCGANVASRAGSIRPRDPEALGGVKRAIGSASNSVWR
jgi:hypothetical protein